MSAYNPDCFVSRKALSTALQARLQACGFSLFDDDERGATNSELVYRRSVRDGLEVWVYTSIGTSSMVRAKGADAIRVVSLYRNRAGRWQPTGKETRVNRVGEIESIVGRVVERMRAAWAKAAKPACCDRCGAPLFLSKKGNMVCAEICWK